jgi:hypothetical protein
MPVVSRAAAWLCVPPFQACRICLTGVARRERRGRSGAGRVENGRSQASVWNHCLYDVANDVDVTCWRKCHGHRGHNCLHAGVAAESRVRAIRHRAGRRRVTALITVTAVLRRSAHVLADVSAHRRSRREKAQGNERQKGSGPSAYAIHQVFPPDTIPGRRSAASRGMPDSG